MKIQVLNPDVIDQIAAGEVLERPANLIKELVENSLDAGADEIEIEFNQGGREVLVTDNGCGMSESDLELSIARHATSKIRASDDLYTLKSFGFRGEALASLAAVSRLSITSREKGADQAHRLVSEFSQRQPMTAVAASVGTQVRVRELFGNVPARLSFLKSEAAENGQIRSVIKALALANENISFRVRSRGELVFHFPKQDLKARALAVLQVKNLFAGEASADGMKVEVLLTSPNETFQTNRNLWLFAQGRWIQDRGMAAAVQEGYRNLLMHGEYPCVVARLTVPAEFIDVNVHPAKAQVKFIDSQKVFRLTRKAVRDVLEKAPWLSAEEKRLTQAPRTLSEMFGEAQGSTENLSFAAPEFSQTQYPEKVFPLAKVREALQRYSAPTTGEAVMLAQVSTAPVAEQGNTPIGGSVTKSDFRWAQLQVIGQLHQTYIVAQSETQFYLIDQHAAHERVVFERLMETFRVKKLDVQTLLLPLAFDLDAAEVEALMAREEFLSQMGFAIERLGPETIAVQTLPALITESAVQQTITKLAHDLLNTNDDSALELKIGDIFATMSCHSVVRAGQTLSIEQMHELLQQMDEFALSSFCPHGRPVYIQRRFTEIEREFGRIP